MASSTSPVLLAESLVAFSKTAYKALLDVDTNCREEVAHANNEAHEARVQRDKALKELHASHLEIQTWKQEANAVKATLTQAELTTVHQADTIARQTDTIAQQTETIAQLRREVTQWKDQSRNWQEHFLRVEQERCALSSRMDELVSERLQWSRTAVSAISAFTTSDAVKSAPSSIAAKRQSIPSPTQPPAYKSAAPPSPSDLHASGSKQVAAASAPKQRGVNKNTKTKSHADPPAYPARETSDTKPELDQNGTTTSAASHWRQPPKPSSSGQSNRAKEARVGPKQTVIRRVQAVINVKQEDSEEEESVEPKEEDEIITAFKRPRSLRRRNCVVEDEEYEPQEEETGETRQLRERRNAIDYHEEDEDDEEEDELMMSPPVEATQTHRTKHPTPAPPKKKRKITTKT